MSKINQIQKRLQELSGGAFQKLADAYLHSKGYNRINPLGSVIGADKVRKGTPDALISLPNGNYIFAEYTTKAKRVYDKLNEDIEKSLDETKTKVPIQKIEEIVVCFTSTLSAEEENALAEKCQKHGVNLNIFGIGPLSYDLYQKYPGLARDFLGVEVDTGQIVPADEFVATHNKNRLATRLDTAFHFREEEVSQALQGLEDGNLVIVSGRAGVGKSRLALECCEQFKKAHPEHEVRCIFNRGIDLFEDLGVYFLEPGHFLIFVDDANRISRFDYVVQLLQNQREDQQIKVVATVRDYALDKVLEEARPCGGGIKIVLQHLEEKQIKQLVEDEYGIRNYLYLDRIAEIAHGNPRLAIMAAEVAKREGTLQSINDVSDLYEEYFASIWKDIEEIGDQDLLKVAGIVAFLQAVDQSNEEIIGAIQKAFGISSETFWKTSRRLHDLEILDMYENEVVRTSDQVLATYLFYIAFFKEQLLDFSVLLNHFFPQLRQRLVDAINPVLNSFDSKLVIETMRPHIDKVWKSLEEADNEKGLLHLMDVFSFIKQTDTLMYIRSRIEEMETKPIGLSELEFKIDSNIPSPSLLSVLESFKYAEEPTFRMALEILFEYLAKALEELPKVLYQLTDRFCFKHNSYLRGFYVQRAVIQMIWERSKIGENELFSKLFLTLAEKYLHTHFHDSESNGSRTVKIIDFNVPATPALFEIRQTIWSGLFKMYKVPTLREEVISVLHSYTESRHDDSVGKIIVKDAKLVLQFIESELDPGSYRHCSMVQEYLNLLEKYKVDFPEHLRDRFRNETYALSDLLLLDLTEMRNLNLDYKKFEQYKKEKIRSYLAHYSFSDYERFFQQCLEIQSGLAQGHKMFQLQNGIVDALLALADRDPELYIKVLKCYLELGDAIRLNSFLPTKRLLEVCGAEQALDILNRPDYPTKRSWLFSYYNSLPPNEVNAKRLSELYAVYQDAKRGELPHDFDYLLKYRSLDNKVVPKVTKIILEKIKEDSAHAYYLSMLFNPYTDVNKAIVELFADEFDLVKEAYSAVLKTNKHEDYDGKTFARILDIKPDFILEYLDQMYERNERLNGYDDTRDYSFIWMRDDYEELMKQVVERIYQWEQKRYTSLNPYLGTFFGLRENSKVNPEVIEKQDRFLKGLIRDRHEDSGLMEFIFSVIAQFPPTRCRRFVALFLEHNKSFEDFKTLPLEPESGGWSGSAVPMHQRRVDYFDSLLPLLNTVDLLQHKQYVERIIQGIRLEIDREKKRDFIED